MSMTDTPAPSFAESGALQPDAVSRLLEMSLSSFRCWVEVLKDLLREPDGRAWLERALASGPVGKHGDPVELLIEGRADKTLLQRMKSESKADFRSAGDDDDQRLGSLATYFLTLAAGLTHYDTMLSRQPDDDVLEVLTDLGDAFPAVWGELLATGLRRTRGR